MIVLLYLAIGMVIGSFCFLVFTDDDDLGFLAILIFAWPLSVISFILAVLLVGYHIAQEKINGWQYKSY